MRANPWRRLDAFLLTRAPELWLMKIHWVLAGSLVACALSVAIGMALTVTPTEYPDLVDWRSISRTVACAVLAGWAWRYLSRTSEFHVSLQWGPGRLFAAHLLCALAIIAPFRALPAVLTARAEHVELGARDAAMKEHARACYCVLAEGIDPAPDVRRRFAHYACQVWDWHDTEINHRGRCEPAEQTALDTLFDIHRQHIGLADGEEREVVEFQDRRGAELGAESLEFISANIWRRMPDLPASLRRTERLWNLWCHQSGRGKGYCDHPRKLSPATSGIPGSFDPKEGDGASLAVVVENPAVSQMEVLLVGLAGAVVATLVTAARHGTGMLFVLVAVAPLVWFLALLDENWVESFAEYCLHPETATVVFLAILAVCSLSRWPGRSWTRGRPMDVLAAFGCLIAPLLPLMWMARLISLRETEVLFSQLVLVFVVNLRILPDEQMFPVTGETLGRLDALAVERFRGLGLHWVCFLGLVLCPLLTTWALMSPWRARRVMPQ